MVCFLYINCKQFVLCLSHDLNIVSIFSVILDDDGHTYILCFSFEVARCCDMSSMNN